MPIANFSGGVNAPFEPVVDAFAANFAQGLELGAAFSVFVDGDPVIDIRAGHADKEQQTPWSEETIACIFSSGKAVLALLVARAVSNGKLDYEAPVATYWPEFGANGKSEITVAQALSHQAGLCAISEDMASDSWLNWDAITEHLAAMAPLWPPGTACGYHPQTFGFIAGELLRRVEGDSVGELLRSFELEIFCGMRKDQMARAAFMPKPPTAPDLGDMTELKRLAFLAKSSSPGRVAREDWMAAEIPASNMHSDARSLARIVHPMANGGISADGDRFLTQDAIDAALRERIRGDDLVLPFYLSWSAGLMRNINKHFGSNEQAFGHAGFGGSCVVIDPDNRLTAAYVMNKMSPYLVGDPRAVRLLDTVYRCL